MIVSLKRDAPELRSYRIVDGEITEEPVELSPDVTGLVRIRMRARVRTGRIPTSQIGFVGMILRARRLSASMSMMSQQRHVRHGHQPAVHANVLDLIGNTPIVDVSNLSPNPNVRILAKLEMQNPFGSVKDRIAKAMIEAAEKPTVRCSPVRRSSNRRRATPASRSPRSPGSRATRSRS